MADRWRPWVPVASWELRRILQRKDFVLSTLLVPITVIALGATLSWLKQRDADRVHRIAVLDAGRPGRGPLPGIRGIEWIEPAAADRSRAALVRAVAERRFAGALLLPARLAAVESVEIVVRHPRPAWRERVRAALVDVARAERAAEAGITAAALRDLDAPLALAERVARPVARATRANTVAAAGILILVIVALFVAVTYMAIGISGEKQARVTEVVLSAVPPQAWIDGKIAAYTVIGLVQALVWGLSIPVALIVFGRTVPPPVNLDVVVAVTLVFAAVGYAFYIALFALVMATIKDLQSTSKFQAHLIWLPFLPLFVIDPALQTPDAGWVVIIGQLPMFAPMLQPARFAVGGVAAWELATSLAILGIAFHLVRRAAGHAFRIGMLMYGKELTLPELWRWARADGGRSRTAAGRRPADAGGA